MWTAEIWEAFGQLNMHTKSAVVNAFCFVSFSEALPLPNRERKEMVVLKIRVKRVPVGQLMKFRLKPRSIISSKNVCFFHSGKQKYLMAVDEKW